MSDHMNLELLIDAAAALARSSPTGDLDAALTWFQHTPLDLSLRTIRVFSVQPSEGMIALQVQHATISQDYTALSYVCGKATPKHTIKINGKYFEVQQNLFDFLHQIRVEARQGSFWVDAICIDQKNVNERNHLVSHMKHIYINAREVIYWLGPPSPNSSMKIHRSNLTSPFSPSYQRLQFQQESNNSPLPQPHGRLDAETMKTLENIACKEYWQRTWVVQEVFHSKDRGTLMMGSKCIPWHSFVELMEDFRVYSIHTPTTFIPEQSPFMRFKRIFDPVETYNLTLGDALWRVGDTRCSDPRDRIFALRSIIREPSFIEVDYNMTTIELFFNLMHHVKRQKIFTPRKDDSKQIYPCSWPYPRQQQELVNLLLKALQLEPIEVQASVLWQTISEECRNAVLSVIRDRKCWQPYHSQTAYR